MGRLTHTVSGNIASFRTPSRVPIESLKFHFLPKQASGTPSPENPIPIEGWTGLNGKRAGKNLYSTIGLIYGKWILGTGEVQSAIRGALTKEIPVSSGEVYSFSYNGSSYYPYSMEVVEYDKNKNYLRRNYSTRESIDIPPSNITFTVGSNTKYIVCGVFSTEDSAITQEKIESYSMQLEHGLASSYESYSGEEIPITFPVAGTNKCNPNSIIIDANMELVNGVYRNTATDTRAALQLAVQLFKTRGTYIKSAAVVSNVAIGRASITFNVDEPDCHYICFKHNGSARDFRLIFPFSLGLGTYTISCDVLSNDPTTVGGVQIQNIQLEVGSTVSSYVAYSSDNTFYGGYIDPVAGEIVAEYYLATARKEHFGGKYTPSSGGIEYRQTGNLYPRSLAGVDWASARQQQKFNFGVIANPWSESSYGNNIGVLVTQDPVNSTYMRISEVIYQAMSDDDIATISYKLETPIHIPISAQDLKAYLDYNNLWSDANDITEVTYPITESKDILATRKMEYAFNSLGDYIKDGLVLHMDGIDKGNVPNAWVDKVNGFVFNAINNPIFSQNCIEMNGVNQRFDGYKAPVISTAIGTIEVVAEMSAGNSGIIYMSRNYGLSLGARNGYSSYEEIIWSAGNGNSARENMVQIWESMGDHKVFSINRNVALIDGVEKAFISDTNYWGNDGEEEFCFIGGRNRQADPRYFEGKIYAIRLYNRQLTSAEMLHNQRIDNLRFKLGLNI